MCILSSHTCSFDLRGRATTWAGLVKFENPMYIVSASLLFAMDTLIAGMMCYILYHSRTEYVRCVLRIC
jgi:hypothetical protein